MHAVFPGTFDPFTLGHFDIAKKALRMFGKLTILVIDNTEKKPLWPMAERLARISSYFSPEEHHRLHVKMLSSEYLLAQYLKDQPSAVLVRGLRHASDFDYEFPIAHLNASLSPGLETIFLIATPAHQYLSSTMVREVFRRGGDISQFIPKIID